MTSDNGADARDPTDPSATIGRDYASTREAAWEILRLLTEQLGMRSSFVSRIAPDEDRFEVFAAHNEPGGCAIPASGDLALRDTF